MLSREEKGARIKEGQAKSNKITGRPKKDNTELKKQILHLKKTMTIKDISKKLGYSRQGIYNILNN
jgi:cell division protein FtsL